MPTVTNLAVSVSARTASFNSKMMESAGIVRTFGRAVIDMGRRMATFGSIARAATVGGLALATRYAFRLTEASARLADKLGLTAAELTGMQFAAGLTGMKASELNKALEQMWDKLNKAGQGADALKQILSWLGIGAVDLAAMVKVIESLGVSLTALEVKQIRGALGAMRRLWLTMKGTGLAIAKFLAPHLEWAADGMLKLAVTARVVALDVLPRLGAYIRSVSEQLVQLATASGNTGSTTVGAFGLMAEAGARFASAVSLMESAWYGLSTVIATVSSDILFAFDKILEGMRDVLTPLPGFITALATFFPIPNVDKIVEQIEGAQDLILKTHTNVIALATSLAETATESLEKMSEAYGAFASGQAAKDFRAWFDDIQEKVKAIIDGIMKLKAIGPTIPDLPLAGGGLGGGAAARARTAEFQQVSLARVALQGVNTPSRPQIVSDPQLAITNEQLRLIKAAISVTRFGLTS